MIPNFSFSHRSTPPLRSSPSKKPQISIEDITPYIFNPADTSKIHKAANALKEKEFILLKENGIPKAIIGMINNKPVIEPVTKKRQGTISSIFLTQTLAISVLKSTDPLSLRDKEKTEAIVCKLHQEGNSIGIQPPLIGRARQYDFIKKDDEDNLTPATIKKKMLNIRSDSLFSTKEAPKMSAHLIKGVKTLHAKDIYHLDIQPHNVLYDWNGAYLSNFNNAIDLSEKKGTLAEIETLREQYRQKDLLNLTDTLCQIAYIAAKEDPTTTNFKSAVLRKVYTQSQIDSIRSILSPSEAAPSLSRLESAFYKT